MPSNFNVYNEVPLNNIKKLAGHEEYILIQKLSHKEMLPYNLEVLTELQ
jgi:hypothetical protein